MSRTVFFKPLHISEDGTQWIPHGLAYRPFHLDHEEVDSDATEAHTFTPSSALEDCLLEFTQTIRPSLEIPSFERSMCALLAESASLAAAEAAGILSAFKERVMGEMLKFKHDLGKDPEVAKQVRLDGPEAVHDDVLAMQLVEADMLSTHGKLIELKAWVCMFTELHNYHVHDNIYMTELIRLHARWHNSAHYSGDTIGPRLRTRGARTPLALNLPSCNIELMAP
ncbi:hypothetical protein B0H16DRAFT_1470745 [Mycena metata]|uniref:Uncharacterized protein n=1 Tax=Mycena metata TaxID=1033252 RepID=A0AAD7HTC9_9AGAR|nr:hypothetical protein B0H16DRAFT_1470745 [Mycena metata]